MGDEFQLGSSGGNWWDTSSRSSAPSAAGGGWGSEIVDINNKGRSSMDSSSVSGCSIMFSHKQQLQPPPPHESSTSSTPPPGLLSADPNLQIMGLALSSQPLDWNQPVFRDEKGETSSFRTMLQEGMRSNANFHHHHQDSSSPQDQWRQKLYTASSEDSSVNEYKQMNRGFSLQDHHHQQHYNNESAVTCQGLTTSFNMENSAYGNPSTLQQQGGILVSDNNSQQQLSNLNYSYQSSGYGELMPKWSKFPQFLRGSPPKQQGHLHFSNSTPFWNATAAAMNDVPSTFFPSHLPTTTPTFDDKPPNKNTPEARDSSATTVKKTGGEASSKRPRNETPSSVPAFKVRKEKMGDRITALQQLVSPFGKTDTASVLSEAIEYIKFLHEQVNMLSTPYMKSGASVAHQQSCEKSKDGEGKQDLRSRGLCLVPVSSTFPVTHESTHDFWTPTFGGTFR